MNTPIRHSKARVLRNSDSFLGFVVLTFSGLLWYLVEQIPEVKYRAIAPTFFPYVITVTLAILGVLLICEGWRQPEAPVFKVKITRKDAYRLILFLLMMLVYLKTVNILGFILTSIIFVALAEPLLGERRPHVVIMVALGVPAGLYVLFFKLLRVILPTGILG
jgi:putative tricarboxylic transport membrane protein